MAEIIADLLHRQALVEEVLRRRVAKRVRTAALADDPEAVEAAADNVPDRAPGHRSNRGIERQEQRSVRASGTNFANVAKDGLADAARKRIVMRAPRLRAAHPQRLLRPVQIIEPQAGDLPGTQPIGDQHHQDGAVAPVDRPVALGGSEQAQDLAPGQPLRDCLTAMEPRRHDPVCHPGRAPALAFGEPEKSAKTLRVVVDRDPAIAAGVPARDRLIDVGHRDRSQGDSALVQPIEEAIDRAAATSNRLFRPPTIGTHPRCEDRDLAGVSVSGLAGFFEQIDEAQPSYCVADESLTCLGQRGLAASAPTGQRPLLGGGLDAGPVHTIAFVQIEKVDQIDLMSGDRSQRLRSNAHLFAMHEIAKALFEERRSAVPLENCTAGEEILEHDRVSWWSET